MYRALETYHDRFRTQGSAEALIESLWSEVRRLGIGDCNYVVVPKAGNEAPRQCSKFRNWDSPWDDFYLEQNYHQHDNLFDYCQRHTRPVFWDDDYFAPGMDEIQTRITNEASQFGIYGGRAYPLPETGTFTNGIFNIVQRAPFDSDFKSWKGRDGELHSMLTFAHLALSDMQGRMNARDYQTLNGTERTSLERLIGRQKLSEINISGLKSARQKLAAHTNHEAVLRAFELGMITP